MASLPLITPSDYAVVLVDYQAGLAFAAGSADRQGIRSAALALAKTAVAFSVPVVVSTSATKVYSGPLMPPLRAVLTDVVPIERRNMNLWEDEAAKAAVVATGRRTLVVAGLLTEACVSFPVLSALAEGYRVRVVADACGGPDAGQPLGGAAAHAAGWRCIDLVAAGIARVPARLDSPRDVRGRARDRGRVRRWLRHRVGLRPRHD
jgi:nicotinamidase-related amidase